MSKLTLSATLVLVALFGLPVTAQAAQVVTQVTPSTASVSLYTEDDDDEFEDEDESEYEEDGEAYESEEEDESFVVPPVVIDPNNRNSYEQPEEFGEDLPAEAYQMNSETGALPGKPIQVDQVKPTVKTPTDLFVDSAVVGLGAVGAGALALGTMVGVRTIRARRNGEKDDYFYGE